MLACWQVEHQSKLAEAKLSSARIFSDHLLSPCTRTHVEQTASCGLWLDDEAVRIAVGLRLGMPLCAIINASVEHWWMRPGTHCEPLTSRTE